MAYKSKHTGQQIDNAVDKAIQHEFTIGNLQKAAVTMNAGITANAEALAKQAKELETKAPREGYAPDLKVDFAKELVGRGVAEPQEICIIRPTGEISIGDGNATIEKVKGKSVVWNQLVNPNHWESVTNNGVTFAVEDNGRKIVVNGTASGLARLAISKYFALKGNHRYALMGCPQNANGAALRYFGTPITDTGNGSLKLVSKDYRNGLAIEVNDGVSVENAVFTPRFYDLTQIFLAGNEPTTIEEFKARKPLGVTDDYNEGEIISYDAQELKSVGINAWDEEWEVGGLAGGEPSNTTSQIRSKNYIPCVGGQNYYGYMGWSVENYLHLSLYDSDKVHIGNVGVNRKVVTLPANASYFKVFTTHDCGYGNVYKGDICINLSHSGYRNGEYLPYEEDTLQLPNIKAIKDKDGNQLFPYGLLSAGSAHDEITAAKAVKRIGVVDMGTMNWERKVTNSSGVEWNYFFTSLTFKPNLPSEGGVANAISPLYECAPSYALDRAELRNKTYMIYHSGVGLFLRDDSYTGADALKAALSGVMLYYELAEPIEVDLPEPLNMTYDAWDFGTEELIAEGKTTPLNADIVYQFNAVDRIRENTAKNQALEAELVELKAQLTQLTQVSNDENSNT